LSSAWYKLCRGLLLSAALLEGDPSVLSADDDRDVMNAPEGMAPLRDVLARVHADFPGRALEVELEQEPIYGVETWIYEVKMLTRGGRVYELEYDAFTLELLKTEGLPECPRDRKPEDADESACRRR